MRSLLPLLLTLALTTSYLPELTESLAPTRKTSSPLSFPNAPSPSTKFSQILLLLLLHNSPDVQQPHPDPPNTVTNLNARCVKTPLPSLALHTLNPQKASSRHLAQMVQGRCRN